MSEIKRGDIWWVDPAIPVGVVTTREKGRRPAVIVSNDRGNNRGSNVLVCYITSKQKRERAVHVPIVADCGFGRPINGTVLCEQITTVDATQLDEYAATVDAATMAAIDRAMLFALALNDRKASATICNHVPTAQPVQRVAAPAAKKQAEDSAEIISLRAEKDVYKWLVEHVLGGQVKCDATHAGRQRQCR